MSATWLADSVCQRAASETERIEYLWILVREASVEMSKRADEDGVDGVRPRSSLLRRFGSIGDECGRDLLAIR